MDQIVFHEPSGDVVPSLRGPELENGEKESPLGCGVGTFLRDERQKKGLDHSQISEITRIRPHFLEAIENEDWDHLPSSVFVKSFIRSYARALGLEEGEIVSRYQNETPPKTISPKTAQEPAGSKKIRSVVLIVLLIIVGVGYYYWRNLLPGEENAKHPKFEGAVSEQIADSEPVQEVIAGSESPFSNGREEAGAGPILPAGGSAIVSEENPEDRTAVFESAVEIIKREALRETSDEEEARVTYYKENATPPEPEISPEVAKPELILTASVLEKTWLRVFVDGENPKEYIFNPGSNPVWRASEGFELLIGNAGGIELKLNGQEIKKLGSPGQVVHLNLPEGYIRKALED